jgi:hypothetical protein
MHEATFGQIVQNRFAHSRRYETSQACSAPQVSALAPRPYGAKAALCIPKSSFSVPRRARVAIGCKRARMYRTNRATTPITRM